MAKRVIVFHSLYGCDTGCCGHVVEIGDGQSDEWGFKQPEVHEFAFDHPDEGESDVDFVRRVVTGKCGEEHVKDIDWLGSIVVSD